MTIRMKNEKEERENGFSNIYCPRETFQSDGKIKKRRKEVTLHLLSRTDRSDDKGGRRVGQKKEIKNRLVFCKGCYSCIKPCDIIKGKNE